MIVAMLLAHLIGDYIFQWDGLANWKSRAIQGVLVHGAIVSSVTVLMALLIDARCISAGEGWTSWFVAKKRARLFGEATAGASSRKRTYPLKNGLYAVTFPVKAYTGYLDRPIERRGLEPDVPLRQNAQDLAAGRDTVLEAARRYLVEAR